jgi:hypothetical protein
MEIGLALYNDQANLKDLPVIPLRHKGDNLFSTVNPLAPGTRFKIRVNNSTECYTYVFGQENDGSSYVLFPYTPKHSPYCGITGTRFFPRDYSMQPDSIGKRDYMAIVITKEPVNYKDLNNANNQSRCSSFSAKIMEALNERLIEEVAFTENNGTVSFETRVDGNKAVAVILEVDKR